MLLFGTPSEYDTGSNESHHKPSKYAAKLTQRNEATFILQSAIRITEFLVLDLALFELEHGVSVQDYFRSHLEEVRKDWVDDDEESWLDDEAGWEEPLPEDPDSEADDCEEEVEDDEAEATDEEEEADCLELQDRPGNYYLSSDEEEDESDEEESEEEDEEDEVVTVNCGTKIRVYRDSQNDDKPSFRMLTRSKELREKTRWDSEIVEFLVELQHLARNYLPDRKLCIFTEHRRDGVMFRGHPNYRCKGHWRDWVVVDWGAAYGKDPCHIWCFVELSGMPRGRSALHFGGAALEDGVHAVVEWPTYDDPETTDKMTDLFVPLTLDVGESDAQGKVTKRAFYLANVEAFVRTCIVIRDVGVNGDPTNEYFEVKPRSLWVKEFMGGLRRPHDEDEMDWTDFDNEKERLEEEKRKKEEEKSRKALEKQRNKKRKST